jgi:hypothetical protein
MGCCEPWVRGLPFRGPVAAYGTLRTLGTRAPLLWAGGGIWDAANPGYAAVLDVLEEALDLVEQFAASAGVERAVVL